MDQERLWAKSKRDDESEHRSMLLPGHLQDVYHAAERVLDATADDQLRALGLDVASYGSRLRRIVLLAAAVHDLGKANDHFQGMLLKRPDRRDRPQGLRHEWVTLLMLQLLRPWLQPAVGGDELEFALVEWAVSGHHPAHDHASPPRLNPAEAGATIQPLTGHDDFRAALAWLKKTFSLLPDPPDLDANSRNLVGSENVFAEIAGWSRKSQQAWDEVRKTPEWRLVAAAKNTLIAADVAGSALPREMPGDDGRWDQIDKALSNKPKPSDLQFIVDWRLKRERRKGNKGELLPFQILVAESTAPVTYVKAGCGSGKTLAAYQWAAKQYPDRRLFFCYPTTGTATEGFKDYLHTAEVNADENDPDIERLRQIEADLFHSRRDVDFEVILSTGADAKSADSDAAAKLEALEAWSTPVVACTVDTVLGLMQNNRRGLFLWPALAQSAFVFDEIHAYDDRLFGALLRFLQDLPGLPALLMTASLPKAREEALASVLMKQGRPLNQIPTKEQFERWETDEPRETLPRYRKERVTDNDPLPIIRETLKNGGKVLWVCNTVGRVMDAADRASKLHPLIYHSRFKYEHRVARHKAVIDAFDPEKNTGAALAICSQVAEMSLDLSADLLVTDLALVPSLIQRLGRLARRLKAGQQTRPFVLIEPDTYAPYTDHHRQPDPPGWPDQSRTWWARLPEDGISQSHLANAWEQTVAEALLPRESKWLDGGPITEVGALREESEGVTVLMKEDRPRVKAKPKDLARLLLPMPPPPRSLDWLKWEKERGIPIAEVGTVKYCSLRGAEWNA